MSDLTPNVFISAVSGDLRSARRIVKDGLLTIGCHPIVQEHFEPGYQTVREMLKTRVESCQAVIHLVGKYYGGEPNLQTLPLGIPRRSWTQMEYDLARELGIKTYVFILDDAFPFDVADPEPEDEIALQEAHRQRVLSGDYLYNKVKTPEELAQRILEMRIEAAELREKLKATVDILATSLDTMEENATELKEGQRQILTSVEEMRSSFASFSELGGIIPEPKSPEQFYFNARISEIKGDYRNARRFFIDYFQFDVECIDPHLRFIEFLKVQEGLAGARETYRHVVRQSNSVVHHLAEALIWDRPQRIAQLVAFMKTYPDCGPVYYLLSQEYSEIRLGTRTLEDKRREKRYLDRFCHQDGAWNVVRWLVDKALVAEWRVDCANRLATLESSKNAMQNPAQVHWLCHNQGWTGTIQIPELATEIFWRAPGKEKFASTGFATTRSYSTGQPQPSQIIELAKVGGMAVVEVAYKNLNGDMMGPYRAVLEPNEQSHAEAKQMLNISKRSWVSIREYDGMTLLYFTHLLCYRGGLKQIAYGLNSNPRFRVVFPEYNQPGPAPIDASLPVFVTIPNDTEFVTVQVVFKDGTPSEIVTVQR